MVRMAQETNEDGVATYYREEQEVDKERQKKSKNNYFTQT